VPPHLGGNLSFLRLFFLCDYSALAQRKHRQAMRAETRLQAQERGGKTIRINSRKRYRYRYGDTDNRYRYTGGLNHPQLAKECSCATRQLPVPVPPSLRNKCVVKFRIRQSLFLHEANAPNMRCSSPLEGNTNTKYTQTNSFTETALSQQPPESEKDPCQTLDGPA